MAFSYLIDNELFVMFEAGYEPLLARPMRRVIRRPGQSVLTTVEAPLPASPFVVRGVVDVLGDDANGAWDAYHDALDTIRAHQVGTHQVIVANQTYEHCTCQVQIGRPVYPKNVADTKYHLRFAVQWLWQPAKVGGAA